MGGAGLHTVSERDPPRPWESKLTNDEIGQKVAIICCKTQAWFSNFVGELENPGYAQKHMVQGFLKDMRAMLDRIERGYE